MADHLEYRLRSMSVGPFMAPPGGHHTWGFRLSPRLELHLDNGFFAELRVEGGAAHEDRSPLGVNMFNSNPSSTLDERNPMVWRHIPEGREDHLRANAGLRNLVLGYRFTPDFSIRVGRYRFDQTEYERLFNPDHAWSQPINYARVNMRLDWIGTELRYDHSFRSGVLRRSIASSNVTNNADGTILSMSQGLLSFALNESEHPPLLTLTGYFAFRTSARESDELDPGHVLGAGGAVVFDYKAWSSGIAYTHSRHSFTSERAVASFQERHAATAFLDFHPNKWRFRGLFSHLSRVERRGMNPYEVPVGGQEIHGEFAIGYTLFGGLTPTLIYRLALNNEADYAAHILAIGLQTSWSGTFSF